MYPSLIHPRADALLPRRTRWCVKAGLIGMAAAATFAANMAHAFGPESHKYFKSETGKSIESVCVIPSYTNVSGLGIGPDGTGRKSSSEKYLLKPFKYVSSENLYAKLAVGGGVIIPIPPGFGFGETRVTDQMLFVKSGYLPLRRRGDYDGSTETLTLKSDRSKQAEAVVDAILRRDTGSPLLRQYFLPYGDQQPGSLVIKYSPEDDEVLQSCLGESGN